MSADTPLVTVLLPVYNAETWLREAIDSILAQTFKDFELLILNDGSTDQSAEILQSYTDPRIRVIHNEINLRLIATLNKGIQLARGMYIARMDADDISHPDRLRIQLAFLEKHPDAALVASPIELMNADGEPTGNWPEDFDNRSPAQIRRTLARTNCVAHPTILMKKAVLEKYAYLPEQAQGEDWDLWMRIVSDGGKIYKTEDVLLRYRMHPESMTHLLNKAIRADNKSNRVRKLFLLRQLKQFHIGSFEWRVAYALARGIGRDFKFHRLPLVLKSLKAFVSVSPFTAAAQFAGLRKAIEETKENTDLFFFFPYLHMGGAEKVHVDIVAALADQKPWVFITGYSQSRFFEKEFRAHSRLFEIPHAANHPWYATRTRKLICAFIDRQNQAQVFGCANHLFYDLAVWLARPVKRFDLKHDFRRDMNVAVENAWLQASLRMERRVFVSQRALDEMKVFYAEKNLSKTYSDRLIKILNAVPIPSALPPKKTGSVLNVLYAGRGTAEKRAQLVGRLAAEAHKQNLALKFTIAGDVSETLDSKAFPYVDFRGEVKDETLMTELYAAAHVVLITSSREGFPMSVMQGMANGAVPLSSPVGDIPLHIEKGKNGWVCSAINEEILIREMLSKLKEWIADRSGLEKISQNAYEYASANFRKERFAWEYRALFGKI